MIIVKFSLGLRNVVGTPCLSITLCGAETWAYRKVEQKYLQVFEIWVWSRMEISWTDRVENEILHRAREERDILHTVNRMKAKCIGHILRRDSLLKRVTEGKKEVTRRRTRRRKHLVDDFKEMGVYWKLKEEAIDRTVWVTGAGRGYVGATRGSAGKVFAAIGSLHSISTASAWQCIEWRRHMHVYILLNHHFTDTCWWVAHDTTGVLPAYDPWRVEAFWIT